MRIATWNLERPKRRSWKIRPAQQRRMAEVAADIWVLTETRASVSPGDGYHGLHCPPHTARRPDEDERWVSVWSRWPARPVDDHGPSPSGALAAWCETPSGPVIVYGTVLPWANEPDDAGHVRMWAVHEAEVHRQAADWLRLRERFPTVPLLVAGDFNQDRDGAGWYGSRRVRDALTAALDGADLVLLTDHPTVAVDLAF